MKTVYKKQNKNKDMQLIFKVMMYPILIEMLQLDSL